jgi:hypothetical protein
MKRSSKSRKKLRKRPLGLYRGKIWIAPDFGAEGYQEKGNGAQIQPEKQGP